MARYGCLKSIEGLTNMTTTDDLEYLRVRLTDARRNVIGRMAAERDRAVPDVGLLHMVADIETSLRHSNPRIVSPPICPMNSSNQNRKNRPYVRSVTRRKLG